MKERIEEKKKITSLLTPNVSCVPRHAHRRSFRRHNCVCMCVIVYFCPFFRRSSSRHGYHVNFGGTFVYMYVYDFEIESLLLMRVIGVGRPLLRNFGRTFACVCARRNACTCVCVCACVRSSLFCNRSSSQFRYPVNFARARGCVRVHMRAC